MVHLETNELVGQGSLDILACKPENRHYISFSWERINSFIINNSYVGPERTTQKPIYPDVAENWGFLRVAYITVGVFVTALVVIIAYFAVKKYQGNDE